MRSAPLAARLLPHLPSRFVFVVGKGGVGKTTTAGALALAFAAEGRTTHLLSTDPAHSLGDLFGLTLPPGRPVPSPCNEKLVLEELDGEGYARRWSERARRPLLEIFDQGSFLDAGDVAGFLDLTLPGIDEVAGVLRLSELVEGPERVVVDTAPTGHTLRLLDAGEVIRSWTEAFDAMAAKAAAVVGQLARRPVRFDADDLVENLQLRIRGFEEAVLANAAAVLVERSGTVVRAETERLGRALEARGLPVGLRLRVLEETDSPAPPSGQDPRLLEIPFRPNLQGCEGLARWGEPGAPLSVPEEAAPSRRDARAFLSTLPSQLLLFVGKGGVGKSSCAAAAALELAEQREVTLLSTDPAGSLADVLAVPLKDGEARLGKLLVRQVEAVPEFQALASRYQDSVEEAFQSLGLDRGAALDRRVLASLLGLAPPGLDEVFAVVALLDDVRAGRTVVLDSAPTGHFLRLAATPEIALAWTHQLLRVVKKYRAALGLDAFAERLLDFAKRLKELKLTLSDPRRSAALVVTLPGPLVAAETRRLLAGLGAAQIAVAAVIANRTPFHAAAPPPPAGAPESAGVIRAPLQDEPPVGVAALRRFLSEWTLLA